MAAETQLADLEAMIGQAQPPTRWFDITQEMIAAHADTHQDWQFIHIDPERAADTPFGTTIAHGFLTLSMLSAMIYDTKLELAGATLGVNYGFNKLRFLAPVPTGAKVRAHFTPTSVSKRAPGEILVILDVWVEIQGQDKPALAAQWLNLYLFETETM